MSANKGSLIARYPMLGKPALWIVAAGALTVAIGWVIATDPLVSYVDQFPFNRNWLQCGNGSVVK